MTRESSTATIGCLPGLGHRPIVFAQVLIHAGSGGVGLAAVSVAMAAGCQLFCTAGSRQKRSYLRALGVRNVANSRDAAFADAGTCCMPAGVQLRACNQLFTVSCQASYPELPASAIPAILTAFR